MSIIQYILQTKNFHKLEELTTSWERSEKAELSRNCFADDLKDNIVEVETDSEFSLRFVW